MSIKQTVSIVVAAVIGGVVGASIVLSEVRAQDYSELVRTPKTLTANSIELTDGNGHIRCKISAEAGSPICFFYGPVGRVRMRIGLGGAENDYAPFIAMNDSDMHERLGIGLSKAAEGEAASYLRLRDSKGRGRLLTGYIEGHGPAFSLFDDLGNIRGSLTELDRENQNAGLFLANPASEDYAQLTISKLGSSLSLGSGRAGLSATTGKANGSNLFLADGSGNLKMHLGVGTEGKARLRRYGKKHFNKRVEKLLLQPKQTKEIDIGWPTTTETAKP